MLMAANQSRIFRECVQTRPHRYESTGVNCGKLHPSSNGAWTSLTVPYLASEIRVIFWLRSGISFARRMVLGEFLGTFGGKEKSTWLRRSMAGAVSRSDPSLRCLNLAIFGWCCGELPVRISSTALSKLSFQP